MERPTHPVDWELIERYLAGDLSGEERLRAESSLRGHPRLREMLDVVERKLASVDGGEPRAVEQAYAMLMARVRTREEKMDSGVSDRRRAAEGRVLLLGGRTLRLGVRSLRTSRMKYAMSALAVTAAAMLFVTAVPTIRRTVSQHQSVVISRVYTTYRAQQATVTLDDGSTVTLAPETWMHYTVDRAGVRSIELIGEAVFSVVSHVRTPFVVHTGSVTTRVLGTTFDVRCYAGDAATLVTVVNGRVATSSHATPVVLVAGTMARVTDSSTTVSPVSNPTHVVSWTQGDLVFTEAPLPVVLATLSRWYGYEFHMADTTLASKVISGKFRTDQITETMNTLKAVLGVTMSFDGKVVTLRLPRTADTQSRRTSTREFLHNLESEVGK